MANFLIVDDDPIVRKLLETALRKHGYSSVPATDTFDALDKCKAERFDLIVCDINMPGFSGLKFISTIKADEALAGIPVLFLSGRREKRDIEKAMAAGGDDYLVKPIDFDLFFAKVESLLKKQQNTFAETVVDEPAAWTAALKVIGVSEQGLTFSSKVDFPINFKFTVASALFQKLGIEGSPQLRVALSTPEDKGYRIKVSFIGLAPAELQNIRKWLIAQQHRKAS